MIVLPAMVFGALLGALLARKRGGRRLDMAHQAAVMGILLGVIGMIVTIVVSRAA